MDEKLIGRMGSSLLHIRKASNMLSDHMEVSIMELGAMGYLMNNSPDSKTNIFAQDLSQRLHSSKATVSQMITSIEKRGYIKRDFYQDNRRKIILTLTEKGRQVLSDTQEQFNKLMRAVIFELGDEKARSLVELFEQFSEIIDMKVEQKFNEEVR